MNQNLLIIIYTLWIYLIGGLSLKVFNDQLIKKNNLFLNLGLSWGIGNAILILILYFLAFAGKLEWIQLTSGAGLLVLVLIGGMIVLMKSRKIAWRFKWQNWLLLLGSLIFLLPLIRHSFFAPLNAWDALGVWLIKAKALFYFPGVIESGFFKESFYDYTHQDYPLALPLLVTAFYRLLGSVNDQAVQFYLLNFFINFIFILTGTMIQMSKNRIALSNIFIITLLIIEMPNMILFSHNGYADIPMAFFMIAAMKLFFDLFSERKTTFNTLPLLILMTLTSASFKVEGFSFIGVMGITLLIMQWVKPKNLRKIPLVKISLATLIGLAPITVWEIYKYKQGIADTYAGAGLAIVNFSKLKMIIHYYFNELFDTNRYLLTLILAFFVYALEVLFMISKKMIISLIPHLIIFGQLTAYTILYLISPHPLIWQLSSFERIALPLIGMLLMLIFYNFNCLWPKKNES